MLIVRTDRKCTVKKKLLIYVYVCVGSDRVTVERRGPNKIYHRLSTQYKLLPFIMHQNGAGCESPLVRYRRVNEAELSDSTSPNREYSSQLLTSVEQRSTP